METQGNNKEWYDNKFITHLLLLLFFPVGLYALWKSRTIAKWWKITATVLIALIVILNLGGGDDTSSSTDHSSTNDTTATVQEEEKAEPKSDWEYSTEEDKMSGEKMFFAATVSTNEIEFEFPYGGGSTFTLAVRNMKKENEVLMTVSKGQFLTSLMSEQYVRMKFDDEKPINVNYSMSDNGSLDIIFFKSTSKILAKLKTAKKIMIEAPFFDAGRQIVYFDVEGLVWDK